MYLHVLCTQITHPRTGKDIYDCNTLQHTAQHTATHRSGYLLYVIYSYILNIYICTYTLIHIHMYTCIRIYDQPGHPQTLQMSLDLGSDLTYLCVYTPTSIYIHIYTHTHSYICTYIHTHTFECIHIYTYITNLIIHEQSKEVSTSMLT